MIRNLIMKTCYSAESLLNNFLWINFGFISFFLVSYSCLSSEISSNIAFQLTLFGLSNSVKAVFLASYFQHHPAGIFLFKGTNGNTRTTRKICSKLTVKTRERHSWCRSVVNVFNFQQIVDLSELVTLNKHMPTLRFLTNYIFVNS